MSDGRFAWVLGAGGLLGSAVCRHLRRLGRRVLTSDVAWSEPAFAVDTLLTDARRLDDAGEAGWQLYWCAGAGVVGSTPEVLATEVKVVRQFVSGWRPASVGGPRGVFLASSAGGLYAGAGRPPYTEAAVPAPLSPYGKAKLEIEGLFESFARQAGPALLTGRFSNLYGPGQDLTKPQGLVSQLCLAERSRQPLSIYVSLDTMRDYLYVDDAAAMTVAGLDAVTARGGRHVKILASEQSTTIASILGDLRRITRRRPPVVMGASPNARYQVRDLRMRSAVWPPLAHLARTPIATGMSATLAALDARSGPIPQPRR